MFNKPLLSVQYSYQNGRHDSDAGIGEYAFVCSTDVSVNDFYYFYRTKLCKAPQTRVATLPLAMSFCTLRSGIDDYDESCKVISI